MGYWVSKLVNCKLVIINANAVSILTINTLTNNKLP
jgi:hypothetical protein